MIDIDDMDAPTGATIVTTEEGGLVASQVAEEVVPPTRNRKQRSVLNATAEPPVRPATNLQALASTIDEVNQGTDDGLGMVQSTDEPQHVEFVEVEPVAETAVEPTHRPRRERKPVAEPVAETVAEPVAETVVEPTHRPRRERKPVAEPVGDVAQQASEVASRIVYETDDMPSPVERPRRERTPVEEMAHQVASEVTAPTPRRERPPVQSADGYSQVASRSVPRSAPRETMSHAYGETQTGSLIGRDFIERTKIINATPREEIEARLDNIEALFNARNQTTGVTRDSVTVTLVMALWESLGL